MTLFLKVPLCKNSMLLSPLSIPRFIHSSLRYPYFATPTGLPLKGNEVKVEPTYLCFATFGEKSLWEGKGTTFKKLNLGKSVLNLSKTPVEFQGGARSTPMLTRGQHEEVKIKKNLYFLDKYLSSNQGTCITQRPAIIQGEWVQKGDFLCDTTASAFGALSVGKNIAIAYMPWHGYNFEDAILLNETLISNDTYTSLHLEKFEVEIRDTDWGPEILKKPSDNLDSGQSNHKAAPDPAVRDDATSLRIFFFKKFSSSETTGSQVTDNEVAGLPVPLGGNRASDFVADGETMDLPPFSGPEKPEMANAFIANQESASFSYLFEESNQRGWSGRFFPWLTKDLDSTLVEGPVTGKEQKVIFKFRRLGWFNSMFIFPPLNELNPEKSFVNIKQPLNIKVEKCLLREFLKKAAKVSKISSRLLRYRSQLPAKPLSFFYFKRVLIGQPSYFPSFQGALGGTFIGEVTFNKAAFSKKELNAKKKATKAQIKTQIKNTSNFSNLVAKQGTHYVTPGIEATGRETESFFAQKKLVYKLNRPENKAQKKKKFITRYGYAHKKSYDYLDSNGIVRIGTWIQPGDMLVCKLTPAGPKNPAPIEKFVAAIFKKKLDKENFKKSSFYVPKDVFGRVVAIRLLESKTLSFNVNLGSVGRVELYIVDKRRIYIGDKMAGRHGNKGIISNILPRQDMPYLPDGTPIDMVLNPLGVPSRMNLGQVFETLLGLAGYHLKQNYKVAPFDEIYGPEASRSLTYSKLYEARLRTGQKWLFQPDTPGKTRLFDGQTGLNFDQSVTAGYAYMLKLIHLVDHKIHARSTGPYALITQQPVRGRSKNGGQRLGEMEFWALEAFGASYNLQEMMTLKSDDIIGRAQVFDSILNLKPITLGPPEAFRVFINELRSLGISFKKQVIHGRSGRLRSLKTPNQIVLPEENFKTP